MAFGGKDTYVNPNYAVAFRCKLSFGLQMYRYCSDKTTVSISH